MQVTGEFEAAGKTHSGRAVKGSGYPVRFPFVDLAEVSAGGGTIAWIDDAGSLRVGPVSAGADPGPACYGNSDAATVTDANVVLGRLNPDHLLGGSFPIDASRSRAAIEILALRLNLRTEVAAAGIVAVIDDAMAKVLRIVTIERGLDPRDFTLVAFGGGGPLHACVLADALGIGRIVVPEHPGLFSAYGLLGAELRFNDIWSVLRVAGDLDREAVGRAFAASESRAQSTLVEQGATAETIAFRREYDARYPGQSFELTIGYDEDPTVVERHFHDAHRVRYGYDVRDEIVEIVNARLTATGRVLSSFDSAQDDTDSAQDDTDSARDDTDSAQDNRTKSDAAISCHPERFDVAQHRLRRRMTRHQGVGTRSLWIDDAFVEVADLRPCGLERRRNPRGSGCRRSVRQHDVCRAGMEAERRREAARLG